MFSCLSLFAILYIAGLATEQKRQKETKREGFCFEGKTTKFKATRTICPEMHRKTLSLSSFLSANPSMNERNATRKRKLKIENSKVERKRSNVEIKSQKSNDKKARRDKRKRKAPLAALSPRGRRYSRKGGCPSSKQLLLFINQRRGS